MTRNPFKRLWVRWRLRGLKGAGRMAVQYQLESATMRDRLSSGMARMTQLRNEVQDAVNEAVNDATDAESLYHRHAEVVEALQSQLKIREDVELPLLAAINETNLQRYRTEVEIQALRRVEPNAMQEGN